MKNLLCWLLLFEFFYVTTCRAMEQKAQMQEERIPIISGGDISSLIPHNQPHVPPMSPKRKIAMGIYNGSLILGTLIAAGVGGWETMNHTSNKLSDGESSLAGAGVAISILTVGALIHCVSYYILDYYRLKKARKERP